MSIRSIAAALALAASASAGAARAADGCIPQREAEALVLNLAPMLVATTAAVCASSLPPGALLRRQVSSLTAKYVGEGEAAWPLAKEAIKRITGPEASGMLESELARPMVAALVAPLLTREIKASDCPNIDRILTLIDPLPARNTAALVVTIVELAQRDRPPRSGRSAFTICPFGVRR